MWSVLESIYDGPFDKGNGFAEPVIFEEITVTSEPVNIRRGDIIVDVDDTVITSISQLQSIIAKHGEGDTLAVKVYRVPGLADIASDSSATIPDGEYIDLKVTLAIVDSVSQ